MCDAGIVLEPTRWPDALTLDGEKVVLGETQGPWVTVIHALPDAGWVLPVSPAKHTRDFARFFPGLAADCMLECVAMSSQMAEVLTASGRHIPSLCITLSGDRDKLAAVLSKWGDHVWMRGALFSRRDPETVLHVPLNMPLDAHVMNFFPHVRLMPSVFDVNAFARIARAPFATFKGDICRTMIALQDLADDATVALFGLRTN